MLSVKPFQNDLFNRMKKRFVEFELVQEWRSDIDGSYSPRIDIAVGPFAKENNRMINEECNEKMDYYTLFFHDMIEYHNQNIDSKEHKVDTFRNMRNSNKNPRCFIALEIENRGSRKHYLGGIVNASAMGKVGIMVAFTDKTMRALLRQYNYFRHLKDIKNLRYPMDNILILKKYQIIELFP